MIRLTPKNDIIQMDIKMTIPQTEIFAFLQMKGYEIKGFPIHYPAEQGFLLDEPATVWHTFTATKQNENQSEENLFLNVFEKEIKEFLKEIS